MKNKRELSKENTKNKILVSAYKCILSDGIINLKTIDVAKHAKIAHGTLFSHFSTKEKLVVSVCNNELSKTAKEINLLDDCIDISEILEKYLKIMAKNENFYTIMAKEFPFMDASIQRSIIANETIIRNILQRKIIKNSNCDKNEIANTTTNITFLFGTINFYLSRKEFMVNKNEKILEVKRNQIIETFIRLIQ